ncbi:MAG: RidA family protein [Clostridia bacterium]|nr:RidA family protein [Clostridia bacterium]
MNKAIQTKNAPAAVGPYSQGYEAGGFIYVSGQLPINPATGELIKEDVKAAAQQSLTNCKGIIEEAGASLTDVVKVEIFLNDMNDFGQVNEVYAAFFGEHKPARACVEVARLPLDAPLEIQMIAYK